MLDKPAALNSELIADAVAGLSGSPKAMSPKWFYDATGSALFEDITQLPEYYPTRTEAAILRAQAGSIAQMFEKDEALVELGSGASVKTRLLLDQLPEGAIYAPIDISSQFLVETAEILRADYPALEIVPIAADFMEPMQFPKAIASRDKIGFFPGSTIGNLMPEEARTLLSRIRKWQNVSALVLGVDLVKDTDVLVAAYDDEAGVTAAFNKNLLVRLNREAGADFDPDAFAHEARWNRELSRIEMHLVSLSDQSVTIDGQSFDFHEGESLHTENSHKYSRERLEELARMTGWTIVDFWTDDAQNFAVAVIIPC